MRGQKGSSKEVLTIDNEAHRSIRAGCSAKAHLLLVTLRHGTVADFHFQFAAGEVGVEGGEAGNRFLGEAELGGVQFEAKGARRRIDGS